MQNMEGVYILGKNLSLHELGGTFIQIPDLKANEEDKIHNWIISLFKKTEIEKVVIEIAEDPKVALQIGYHIRLSLEELENKTLVPILFVSKLSLNTILLQAEIFSQILTTKGVTFSEFNIEDIKTELEYISSLSKRDYLMKFLKIIHIQPDEVIGRHSLANMWGAYAMDKASNANAALPFNSELKNKLYFKYVSANNSLNKLNASKLKVVGKVNLGDVNKINCENKKVLLIDDESDKGWEIILRKILKVKDPKDFVVINEKVKDFNSFSNKSKRIIENEKFDLYLVDLRLNGSDENLNSETKSFSGMTVLQKIKSINKGYQVIMFTATNKAWNLKALIDAGAEGYYMKESPEYNFSRKLSEENYTQFKKNVEECFKRGYLAKIYEQLENAKRKTTNKDKDFIKESNTSLKMAWELLKNGELDFGFFSLFLIIERYAKSIFKSYNVKGTCVIKKINNQEKEWILTYNKDRENGGYFSSGSETKEKHEEPTTLFKVSCLLKLVYKRDDSFLKKVGELNKLRNDIAHGKSSGVDEDNLIVLLNIIEEIRSN